MYCTVLGDVWSETWVYTYNQINLANQQRTRCLWPLVQVDRYVPTAPVPVLIDLYFDIKIKIKIIPLFSGCVNVAWRTPTG